MDNYMSVTEISETLNVNRQRVYRYAKRENLQAEERDGKNYYSIEDVEKMKIEFSSEEKQPEDPIKKKTIQKVAVTANQPINQTNELKQEIEYLKDQLSKSEGREKEIRRLLNQEQQLHFQTQQRFSEERKMIQQQAQTVEVPKGNSQQHELSIDPDMFEDVESTSKRWWELWKK